MLYLSNIFITLRNKCGLWNTFREKSKRTPMTYIFKLLGTNLKICDVKYAYATKQILLVWALV